MKTNVIEVQYKTQKIEELEAKLAELDEEIRQLKRWKDGLKTIYEDLIDEKDADIQRLQSDLALWDGREKVLCDLIDEKDAEINRLKDALSILQTRPQVER